MLKLEFFAAIEIRSFRLEINFYQLLSFYLFSMFLGATTAVALCAFAHKDIIKIIRFKRSRTQKPRILAIFSLFSHVLSTAISFNSFFKIYISTSQPTSFT